MVLVLDNCEHLGDGPAAVIREVLENCPSLTVLATSQRPLGVPGEMIWPLQPLPRAGALELFVLRVAEMNPRIAFDAANLRSADEICAALDDLPLAIELAARRCGVLSIDEIAERLRYRFELLADRSTRRSRRHSTLANAIGWSYDLLFPDTQLLLQIVSAFPEGATLDALEVVAPAVGVAADELVDLLIQLADRSFVITDRSGRESRYGVLNSVRVFANDRADEAGRTATIRSALATWVANDGEAVLTRLAHLEPVRMVGEVARRTRRGRPRLRLVGRQRSARGTGLVQRSVSRLADHRRQLGRRLPSWSCVERGRRCGARPTGADRCSPCGAARPRRPS